MRPQAIILNFLLLTTIILTSIPLKGQSLYDIDGNKLAYKISENEFNITSSIFTLKEGKFIETHNGILKEDYGFYSLYAESNRINYFDKENRHIGYYIPSENRYYKIFQGKQVEEEHFALLYDGAIYTIDEQPRYRIEKGFPPEILGFILFFFFC